MSVYSYSPEDLDHFKDEFMIKVKDDDIFKDFRDLLSKVPKELLQNGLYSVFRT